LAYVGPIVVDATGIYWFDITAGVMRLSLAGGAAVNVVSAGGEVAQTSALSSIPAMFTG